LPVTLDAAWDFFSRPENLAKITPPRLGFFITSRRAAGRMYAGQIIAYRVKPLMGIPLFWMTEITHVEPGRYFVDEQRRGPYAIWHHEHHFREVDEGVEMRDAVFYSLGFGWAGDLINALLVRRQLREIFEYRYRAVDKLFGGKGGEARVEFERIG